MRIRAFQGLVSIPAHVPEVACVPYDVVNAAEAAALVKYFHMFDSLNLGVRLGGKSPVRQDRETQKDSAMGAHKWYHRLFAQHFSHRKQRSYSSCPLAP